MAQIKQTLKRQPISIETKYEIIQKREKGIKPSALILEYNLKSSTISTIFANKDKIIQEYEGSNIQAKKRIKLSSFPDLGSRIQKIRN